MMPSIRSSSALLALAIGVAIALIRVPSARAQAGDAKARAAEHVTQGQKYQRLGRFDAAIKEYEQAYALVPHPELLFNLAQAYRLNGDATKALAHYRKYLYIEPNGRGAAKAREYVALLEEELKNRPVPAPEPEPEPEPAPEPEAVSPPERSPTREGVTPPAPTQPVDASPRTGGGNRTLRVGGLVTAGVGAVSIALGVKYGLDAASISGELSDNEGAWTDELLDKQDDGESAETKMLVLTGLGAVAVVVGGVMYMLGRDAGPDDADGVAVSPVLLPSGGALVVGGRF